MSSAIYIDRRNSKPTCGHNKAYRSMIHWHMFLALRMSVNTKNAYKESLKKWPQIFVVFNAAANCFHERRWTWLLEKKYGFEISSLVNLMLTWEYMWVRHDPSWSRLKYRCVVQHGTSFIACYERKFIVKQFTPKKAAVPVTMGLKNLGFKKLKETIWKTIDTLATIIEPLVDVMSYKTCTSQHGRRLLKRFFPQEWKG